jgi:hypothetical protein
METGQEILMTLIRNQKDPMGEQQNHSLEKKITLQSGRLRLNSQLAVHLCECTGSSHLEMVDYMY